MAKLSNLFFKLILIQMIGVPALAGDLESALEAASQRSKKEQKAYKVRAYSEKQNRMDSWSERSTGVIAVPTANASLGSDEYALDDEIGEDVSGLTRLKSKVKLESTDIDFDEELREVSLIDEGQKD
ncbi:MAG: hypothetical protein KDD33_13705 [Bdellovibrionales bacterium]|nr:hypothetical protein [Bdellovibrionales bacterium]